MLLLTASTSGGRPLVQSVWLFAPFSQTFDLGSFKFQSFEMLLPWHPFILELLLKTKKKKKNRNQQRAGWRVEKSGIAR